MTTNFFTQPLVNLPIPGINTHTSKENTMAAATARRTRKTTAAKPATQKATTPRRANGTLAPKPKADAPKVTPAKRTRKATPATPATPVVKTTAKTTTPKAPVVKKAGAKKPAKPAEPAPRPVDLLEVPKVPQKSANATFTIERMPSGEGGLRLRRVGNVDEVDYISQEEWAKIGKPERIERRFLPA